MDFGKSDNKRLRTINDYPVNSKDGENTNTSVRRTLHVEALGCVKVVPDLCHLLVKIVSQKVSVAQAKDSVDRRLAYVRQTIQNCHIQETDIKTFQSVEAGYIHTVEIYVTTTEASKLYQLAEVLTQKLDETVTVSPVSFSISPNALAHGRSQSASNAVQNGKKKASEMARLVEGALGPPISVEQLGCVEGTESIGMENSSGSQFVAWQQACVSITSSVRILFELKSKKSS